MLERPVAIWRLLCGLLFAHLGFVLELVRVIPKRMEAVGRVVAHRGRDGAHCRWRVWRISGDSVIGRCLLEEANRFGAAESLEEEQREAAVKAGHAERGVVGDDVIVNRECFSDATAHSQRIAEVGAKL